MVPVLGKVNVTQNELQTLALICESLLGTYIIMVKKLTLPSIDFPPDLIAEMVSFTPEQRQELLRQVIYISKIK